MLGPHLCDPPRYLFIAGEPDLVQMGCRRALGVGPVRQPDGSGLWTQRSLSGRVVQKPFEQIVDAVLSVKVFH